MSSKFKSFSGSGKIPHPFKHDKTTANCFVGIEEAADFLGISAASLYKMHAQVPHYKFGKRIRYRLRDVQAAMKKYRVAPKKGGRK